MDMATGDKAPGAFLTIGELSRELGVAQHILRYWETRFPQLRPLQRAGNRRYYRPADVELARRIHQLLNREGYTVKGVQQLLRARGAAKEAVLLPSAAPSEGLDNAPEAAASDASPRLDLARLVRLRDRLAAALDD